MPLFVRRPNPNRVHDYLEKQTLLSLSLFLRRTTTLILALSLALFISNPVFKNKREHVCHDFHNLLLSFLLLDIYLIALCHQQLLHLEEKYQCDVSKCLSFLSLM